ncbi:MAG: RNA 2',3'-cyclic phosphodiesterase [Solirubrobacterales bacterium]
MSAEQERAGPERRRRLFVAIEIPAPVRAAIAEWGVAALADQALRAVPAQNLHLTLVFLGDVGESRIPAAAASVGRVRAAAPVLRFRPEPIGLPTSRRPGLYALQVDSPGVVGIQREVRRDLSSTGLGAPERRPFSPHVTVARVRRGGGSGRRPQRVRRPPGPVPGALRRPFRAVRVALYRSSFGPDGVSYSPLAQVELSSGEAAVR